MAKRDFPLFIFDTARQHGHGECDFIVCTDQESGFIAKDYEIRKVIGTSIIMLEAIARKLRE